MRTERCEQCNGSHDVTTFWVDDKEHTLCIECRVKQFGKKIPVGGWAPKD